MGEAVQVWPGGYHMALLGWAFEGEIFLVDRKTEIGLYVLFAATDLLKAHTYLCRIGK